MLQEIVLYNYGIFKGMHRLRLSTDLNRPMTLISTITASGKTTLLDAIYWCLYGETSFTSHSLLNVECQREMCDGQKEYVIVELVFVGNLGNRIIRRSVEYQKSFDRIFECPGSRQFVGDVSNLQFPSSQLAVSLFWGDSLGILDSRFPVKLGKQLMHYYINRLNVHPKIGVERVYAYAERQLSYIADSASKIFNEIYFQPGKYKICWLGQFSLRSCMDDKQEIQLSYSTEGIYHISLLQGLRQVIYHDANSDYLAPIIVDDVFQRIVTEQIRLDAFIEMLTKQQALIMIHNSNPAHDKLSEVSGKRYEIRRTQDWNNVTVEEIG